MSNLYRGSLKFDPADFVVPPEVGKGKSQRFQVYVQSAHARAMDIISQSGHFPWGKDQDVGRWAIQYGLQHINKIDPELSELNSIMKQANYISEINADEFRNIKFAENIEETQKNVQRYLGLGDVEFARDLVNRCWRRIMDMPEETPRDAMWKKLYQDKFESLFKQYIDYPEEQQAA